MPALLPQWEAHGVATGTKMSLSSLSLLDKFEFPDGESCIEIYQTFQLCTANGRTLQPIAEKSSAILVHRIWIGSRLSRYPVLWAEGTPGFQDPNGEGVFVKTTVGWESVGNEDIVILLKTD